MLVVKVRLVKHLAHQLCCYRLRKGEVTKLGELDTKMPTRTSTDKKDVYNTDFLPETWTLTSFVHPSLKLPL